MQAFAAAVDWGTTNFRIWLLGRDGTILGERHSADGLAACMPDRFASVLESNLADLGAPPALPVVVCGMAGARTGWREAPYVDAPADLHRLSETAVRAPGVSRDVRILPGVCQRPPLPADVMRGEETQLAGAARGGDADGLWCMPGTHSKWTLVEGGRIARFTTFMTGDLFHAVSRHTILAQSVEGEGPVESHPAFASAVEQILADAGALTARLFSIRAATLVGTGSRDEARPTLSGMLIGAEIAAGIAMNPGTRSVRLVAGSGTGGAYAAALRIAGVEPEIFDGGKLAIAGLHAAALRLFGNGDGNL